MTPADGRLRPKPTQLRLAPETLTSGIQAKEFEM
jgi:hypothetical protein